ncbi:hypothetical protein HPB51_010364 [Rhipicephalus microplus]|uniref:Uncharacterized protein n=1 Tax=Rhipicephalus microplus TaxID=6941 RepID=A0A9J6DTQ9_RHIMP|nr:hypothetical protein HPB51_010364 [Rhipicephalus microplus]
MEGRHAFGLRGLRLASKIHWQLFPVAAAVLSVRRTSTNVGDSVSAGKHELQAKPFEAIPRVPSFPVIGSSWIYWRLLGKHHPDQRHKASMEMYKKYGPIVVERLPGRYSLVHLFKGHRHSNPVPRGREGAVQMGATTFKDLPSEQTGVLRRRGHSQPVRVEPLQPQVHATS